MKRSIVEAGRKFFLIACAVSTYGIASSYAVQVTTLKAATYVELRQNVLKHAPDLDQFRLRGPFDVAEKRNRTIRLSARESVNADLYLSAHADRAPLVIILHGYDGTKEAHAYQAAHLASWGIHGLALQLPNQGPWVGNGRTLARLVKLIHDRPELVDRGVDPNKIILAGHSFGGTSVIVALAERGPAAGGILLDPSVDARDMPRFLARVGVPVLLLGADEYYSLMRNRDYFYRFIRSGIAEISIKDSVHEDAQFPAEDGAASEEQQLTFVSAMTAAAISISAGGNFDFAWSSFNAGSGRGRFFNARKK
jgi:acetyl esterase/lipase